MLSQFKKWMAAAALMAASTVSMAADYIAGTHYKVLEEPVPVLMDGKVHVEEAFWYGCSHCFHLESIIEPWKDQLAADVDFQRVPAMFSRNWILHAQLYYTMDQLKVLDQLHSKVFNSIHLQKQRLLSPEDQRQFVVDNTDVTAEEFDKAYSSFGVKSRMTRGDKRVRAFQITGVPTLIVNGKYVVDATSAGGQQQMLDVADFLINKERNGL